MNQSIRQSKLIGKNIKKFRNKLSLTQEETCARLQVLGCDIQRGTLAKIEAGIRNISVFELESIREVLLMEYADFFCE